jgi:hypothetical protein
VTWLDTDGVSVEVEVFDPVVAAVEDIDGADVVGVSMIGLDVGYSLAFLPWRF